MSREAFALMIASIFPLVTLIFFTTHSIMKWRLKRDRVERNQPPSYRKLRKRNKTIKKVMDNVVYKRPTANEYKLRKRNKIIEKILKNV